jgi:hypothetical protein
MWYPKMDPHSFEEELEIFVIVMFLIVGCEDGHLRKLINYHKYTIISFIGGWKTRHVIHIDGFPWLLRSRKSSV